MPTHDPIQVAHMLIDRHGLRAGAVAEQCASEAHHAGAAEALDRWRAVQSVIVELRRTAHRDSPPAVM